MRASCSIQPTFSIYRASSRHSTEAGGPVLAKTAFLHVIRTCLPAPRANPTFDACFDYENEFYHE